MASVCRRASQTCPPIYLGGGGGKDFVDTIIATNALERYKRSLIWWRYLFVRKIFSVHSYVCWCFALNFLLHEQNCTQWKAQILAVISCQLKQGFWTEFRSEKIPRNIRNGFLYSSEASAHSEAFRVPRKSHFRSSERNGTEFSEKIKFYGTVLIQNKKLLLTRVMETNSYGLYKNSQFEYCQRLLLPRFVELFTLLWNGLEWNSESLLVFLFYGMDFRVVFSSAAGFGREIRRVCF